MAQPAKCLPCKQKALTWIFRIKVLKIWVFTGETETGRILGLTGKASIAT